MKLQDYKAQYEALTKKKNLKGEEAMKAVKQDGYALRYVQTQTEAICLEAVKQNGNALLYVDARYFEKMADDIIELNGVKYKKNINHKGQGILHLIKTMNTIKITLHEVVTTEKEVEVTFPFYIKDKNAIDFIVYFDESRYIKVSASINAIYQGDIPFHCYLENGWTPCQKYEFNEALEKVSKNIDTLYEQVLEAQVKPMVDEVQQRLDLEDAKGQEALENYLNK